MDRTHETPMYLYWKLKVMYCYFRLLQRSLYMYLYMYLLFIYRVLELSTILSITKSITNIFYKVLIASTKCRIGLIQQFGPEKSFVIDASNRDTRKGAAMRYYIWIEEGSHDNLPLGLSFNDNTNGEPNWTPQ